ncbi:MAG: FAD-dependent oxidoreductase [Hyphomicrobium zavarzinii]|jgi:glycine oxidase|uniref:FAD-dependent oxidoreductase n=1 Tax=Hyphomicrobium TaxID=81 RepID=UPI000367050C|nr:MULTISPECIES: FAD-dependent oxidoreductase [Hyphomicrobium]MBL8845886.1 FAD-dependent oxidoreductase [Hyphomicrobium zavarzinii]WBT39719.1 FAD-dependent oxidoreductase [Hyphomicrobium sp. DMF-1]HML43599.1 FAD-dependent oxidoreductase [Hyphomicrobium zavarzinii]
MKPSVITIVGAGITGLWQAYTLAYRGYAVHLVDKAKNPLIDAASSFAGAMLAPFCEREAAPPIVQDLGLRSLDIWRSTFSGIVSNGTLVVAHPEDRNELIRFSRLTEGYRAVNSSDLAKLEPDLQGRFREGLFYAEEAHVEPASAAAFLLNAIRRLGGKITFDHTWSLGEADYVIDCRGMSARDDVTSLRGVKGERIVVQTQDIALKRPVRLLHPRFPLYVVPWDRGTYMIGATVIESEDDGPVTLHSAVDLLAAAYALHPAFGGSRILAINAGVRPAFPDNVPRIVLRGRHVLVNGLYRHGFLLAPALAELVADYLAGGSAVSPLFVEE